MVQLLQNQNHKDDDIEEVFVKEKPNMVIVYGDVNSYITYCNTCASIKVTFGLRYR